LIEVRGEGLCDLAILDNLISRMAIDKLP